MKVEFLNWIILYVTRWIDLGKVRGRPGRLYEAIYLSGIAKLVLSFMFFLYFRPV